MGGGLPQRRPAVARDPGGRVPRRPAGRDRVGDPPASGIAAGAGGIGDCRSIPATGCPAAHGRDPVDWTSEQRSYLERLFSLSPEIAALHDLAQRFGRMVRQHGADDLTPWLAEALESDLRSFAEGLRQDLAAVWAALATPWSNGQTEGQITRLKLIKRSMYGRAKLDLLRIRVMAA